MTKAAILLLTLILSACASPPVPKTDWEDSLCKQLVATPMCQEGDGRLSTNPVGVFEDQPDGHLKLLYNCNCLTGKVWK